MHPPYPTVKLQHPETLHVTPSVMGWHCPSLHDTALLACCGWKACLTVLPAFSSLRFIGGWQNKQLMHYCHQLVWSVDQKGKIDKNNYWWHTFPELCFSMSMRLVSTFICLIWRFDSFAFSPAHISTVCHHSMHPFLSSLTVFAIFSSVCWIMLFVSVHQINIIHFVAFRLQSYLLTHVQ